MTLLKTHRRTGRPPFECVALVLQGGGALGTYQAGAYQALAEASLHPDWIAGVSIGAVNAAIIAGNARKDRLAKLQLLWQELCAQTAPPVLQYLAADLSRSDPGHAWLNHLSAANAALTGVPGLFAPRLAPPWSRWPGDELATSFYDTSPLKQTLERLVDFDRINAGDTRLSVGAVNIRTGNFIYFDTTSHVIGPEHILASAALPPGFPAIEIDGEHYWDGGVVSNTPLQWLVDSEPHLDTLVFQMDLCSARGELPKDLAEVVTRQKEIQYSSRTRAATDGFKRLQRLRNSVADLLAALPPEARRLDAAMQLQAEAHRKVFNVVHLIYHARHYEGSTKDFEFSRLSMDEHWAAGYHDAVRTLRHPEVLQRPSKQLSEGVLTFDVAVDRRL